MTPDKVHLVGAIWLPTVSGVYRSVGQILGRNAPWAVPRLQIRSFQFSGSTPRWRANREPGSASSLSGCRRAGHRRTRGRPIRNVASITHRVIAPRNLELIGTIKPCWSIPAAVTICEIL